MSYLIYTVEDEDNIRELIRCTLESFSYETKCFSCAEDMLTMCNATIPDLILLDIMLPAMDGISALQHLKASPNTKSIPVIMLTAKSSEIDKVTGLDCGADDYIAKPFGILEFVARIKAALRRIPVEQHENTLSYKDIVISQDKHNVTVANTIVELTLKEYLLLKTLINSGGNIVTRDELLNIVWGYDFIGETRTLDMHIKTLRKKLGDDAENPKYIKTVRGVGYTLV